MRIEFHARIGSPFDFYCIGDAPYPIQFGTRAHVHQLRAGSGLQYFVGLSRQQRALVRQIHFLCAGLRGLQNLRNFPHGVLSLMFNIRPANVILPASAAYYPNRDEKSHPRAYTQPA